MKTPKTEYQPYIVRPLVGMSEGEIDLDRAGGGAEEEILTFVNQLLRTALQDEAGENRRGFRVSSLTVQRQASELSGRIYGQAYIEKEGETVIFLRGKLFNSEGRLVMTCMATSHIHQAGDVPETEPED